jgi:hypothetical protein
VIEAVNGPLTSELNLTELAGKDRYSTKVQQTYERAISQARNICQKAKLAALLGTK